MHLAVIVVLLSGSAYFSFGMAESLGVWVLNTVCLAAMSFVLYFLRGKPAKLLGQEIYEKTVKRRGEEGAKSMFGGLFIVLSYLIASTYIISAMVVWGLNVIYPGCQPACS